jgi:hypothetical protein
MPLTTPPLPVLQSANAMLCGRVLLFLAKLLPLTERSGVNLSGGFNIDNATPVEEVAEVGGCVTELEQKLPARSATTRRASAV